MKHLIVMATGMFLAGYAWGADFTANGVAYNVVDGKQLFVEVTSKLDDNGKSAYGPIVFIPAEVEHEANVYKVVKIGDAAFKNSDNLYGIVIENGVETIGKEAFYGCSSIRGLTIPESVKELGESVFSGSAIENISFMSETCPVFPDMNVFPAPEKMRISFPQASEQTYKASFGSILEDKKQLSFELTGDERNYDNQLVFQSSREISREGNGFYEIGWQAMASSPIFDLKMVIYVPSDSGIAFIQPMMIGAGFINFVRKGIPVESGVIECPDAKVLSLMGGIYESFGFCSDIWMIEDIIDNINFECSYPSGVDEIGADSNVMPEYYNMQGVRVANPADGELIIEKRGCETVKRIHR